MSKHLTSLLLLLGLALGVRLALWWLPLHQLANDEHEYVRVARDLLAGRGWQFYESYHWLRAPLYPLFLAGSLALAGGDLHRAALPMIALSLANVWLAYAIAHALVAGPLSPPAGLIAAALAALLLTFATFASLYMLETLFATLLSATLLVLLRYRRQPRASTAALAGLLIGLAALTRSLGLPLLPLGMLYVLAIGLFSTPPGLQHVSGRPKLRVFQPTDRNAWRASAVYALLMLLTALLVILPWTLRNYSAYGRFILIETGLSFNTWAFNEPREGLATIFRELEAIRNPAERADYATARGLERLREDPAILVRKLDDNWFGLWRVKPIEDRFIQQDYYSDVSLGYFVWALAFDDALLLLILLAAAWGMVVAPGWQARLLLGGWVAGTVVSILLTHGEARYRHALLPALLPYAAYTLATLTRRTNARAAAPLRTSAPPHPRTPARSQLAIVTYLFAVTLTMFMAYTYLSTYPYTWAEQRVARGLLQLHGDLAWAWGQPARATELYRQAAEAQPDSVDALVRLGLAYRAQNNLRDAEQALRAAWRLRPTYIPASTYLGDLLREQGDSEAAREAFAGAYAEPQAIVDWAWQHLEVPPSSPVDVGDGLDFGYVGGVYPAETEQGASARWTTGEAWLRVPASGQSRVLRLRLAAPHPSATTVTAQVCARQSCQPLQIGPGFAIYELLLPPAPGQFQTITLRSASFDSPADGRRLGLLLDWFSLSAAEL